MIKMITELKFKTNKEIVFIDVTEKIKNLVKKSDEGVVIILTQHTTTGLWINEAERGLINDMKIKLETIFPTTHYYEHDDFSKRKCPKNERRNGFSHLRTSLFHSSLTIPFKDGKLLLGKYQSIFFVELDGPREERTIIVNVV